MDVKDKISRRIRELPPYLFADLDVRVEEVRKKGVEIIDMGVGDPDQPTPEVIVSAMKGAVEKPSNHTYPSYAGSLAFRRGCANWLEKRFAVKLDPEKEVLALIGSKEGIAHFPLAFIDPGDIALVPDPCYPVYSVSVKFAGGEVKYMPLEEKNEFLPDFSKIPAEDLKRTKIMFLNYPNNPTSASAGKEFFEEAVKFAKKYEIIVVSDAAYSEIYEDEPPPSILEVEGAKEVAIEMHSLSKSFNMTGWRIAFAAGGEEIVKALGKVKTNIDSGAFNAIQEASLTALQNSEEITSQIRNLYRNRRSKFVEALKKINLKVYSSTTTFYVWVRVPEGYTSMTFAEKLLKAGVVCTPGVGFGKAGEGYVRFSLTLPDDLIDKAVSKISSMKGL